MNTLLPTEFARFESLLHLFPAEKKRVVLDVAAVLGGRHGRLLDDFDGGKISCRMAVSYMNFDVMLNN